MKSTDPRLILASASPRRHAFLNRLGVPFVVQIADIDETPSTGESPVALARRLAVQKAERVADAVRTRQPDAVVLAADTVVAQDDQLLGKPDHADEATAMLRLLRDRPHQVLSGICLLDLGSSIRHSAVNRTHVYMRAYTDDEIDAYVASGDPLDKAGGYAIQHPGFRPVDHFDGCYAGVMGLPLRDMVALLEKAGISVPNAPAAVCLAHGAGACCAASG